MQIIDINIQQGQWLTAALRAQGYRNIPTNVILKKTLPGLGATYGEIKAQRNSIIIEPNVPVILGKTKGKPELLAVWEDCTKDEVKRYIRNRNIPTKKLLTTPEGFKKIKAACKDLKINIYNYFFCLFDECEKIVQDIDFRENISQPINDFFLFTNKAFVSATPVKMTHPEFANQGFKILKVKPQYNYKKNLNLIITDNYEMEVSSQIKLLQKSECICVFLNKTDSIDKIVHTLGIKNESKIFCSDKSVLKLKRNGYTEVYNSIDLPLKKYNFFTCRFFSAVDIEIRQKPDILILTNLNEAIHTIIDPFTEAIQIYGRFRDNYHRGQIPFNSLTHITNMKPDMPVKYNRQLNQMVATEKKTYETIYNQWLNETNPIAKETLEKDYKKLSYSLLLDENGKLNHFSLDNLHNKERVKRYYVDFNNWLVRMYRYTGHFIVNDRISHYPFTHSFQSSKMTSKEKREEIVLQLEKLDSHKTNNPTFDIESYKEIWRRTKISDKENGDLIVDAYELLGKPFIDNMGYNRPARLKKAIDKKKALEKEKQFKLIILEDIKQKYQIGQTITKNDIKKFLKELYRLYGIEVSVIQTTVQKYCLTTSNNSEKPSTYTITGYKS